MTAAEIAREIRTDRRRGATALALRALDALELSKTIAAELLRARPAMPLIAIAVRRALKSGAAKVRRELLQSIRKICRHAENELPFRGRYIVYSESGTITSVLKAVRATCVKNFPADVALVGADAIYKSGDFVNACGSTKFLEKARREGCPAIVIASDLKRTSRLARMERGFERVSKRLVEGLLTESGFHRYKRQNPQ